MSKKCLYCGKNISDVSTAIKVGEKFDEYYVCDEYCEEKFNSFNKYVKKNSKFFLLGILGIFIIYLIGLIFNAFYAISFLLFSLGILLYIFPFATPQTNQIFGIKKSIKIVKLLGSALFILGLLAFLIAFLATKSFL
ncbi:MAG: hypothetical protein ACRCYE_05525 [Sarcina sp.]